MSKKIKDFFHVFVSVIKKDKWLFVPLVVIDIIALIFVYCCTPVKAAELPPQEIVDIEEEQTVPDVTIEEEQTVPDVTIEEESLPDEQFIVSGTSSGNSVSYDDTNILMQLEVLNVSLQDLSLIVQDIFGIGALILLFHLCSWTVEKIKSAFRRIDKL